MHTSNYINWVHQAVEEMCTKVRVDLHWVYHLELILSPWRCRYSLILLEHQISLVGVESTLCLTILVAVTWLAGDFAVTFLDGVNG